MKSLSLCMIVKNEEENLERCLSSVFEIFDEIIIVDTGSTDNTKAIAKKFTNKVYDFIWVDDFSLARNFGIKKATCDYFMWLDADDIITKDNLEKLKKLKSEIIDEDVFMLKYAINFDENNNPTFEYYRERICKNNGNFLFHDFVHEAITPSGKVKYLDIVVEHRKTKENKKGRNLILYEKNKNKTTFSARQQFYYSRELYYNNKIKKAITNFKKFLKMDNAFLENKIEAHLNLSNCYIVLKDYKKAKQTLFDSFMLDTPRSEILCNLAYIYNIEQDYIKAIYYFNLATKNAPNLKSGAFIQKECYNYIPFIEMCVCYFNLKEYEKAYFYNELALKNKPNDKNCLNNKILLSKYLINNKT